jgi:hypothetical protein
MQIVAKSPAMLMDLNAAANFLYQNPIHKPDSIYEIDFFSFKKEQRKYIES